MGVELGFPILREGQRLSVFEKKKCETKPEGGKNGRIESFIICNFHENSLT
jgi:hypothetical protein